MTRARRYLRVEPPLPPQTRFRRRGPLPFPLDDEGVELFARGRHGLLVGVAALGIGPDDEVLVPAYHHGSEVNALVAAGIVPRFYGATESLAPDPGELEELCGDRTRALLLIHYLGFPQDSAHWRSWCDERGVLLLEDAAQAWLADDGERPLGYHGDLAITCLYKTFGLPDGAALLLRSAAPVAPIARAAGLGLAGLANRHGAWAASRSALSGRVLASVVRSRHYDAAADIAVGNPTRPCRATTALLPRLTFDAAARRRERYTRMLEGLADLVPEPFAKVPAGASPYGLPIEVADKRAVRERLLDGGIEALDFWSVPHPLLPAERFASVAHRRASTLLLPVHQELRAADVDGIVAQVRHAVDTGSRRAPARDAGDAVGADDGRDRVEVHHDLDALAAEWGALATASRNVFSTPEFAATWWAHFGRGAPTIVTSRDGRGALVALWPLGAAAPGPVRVARVLGHGPADELGPVCRPTERAAAAIALRRAVDEGLLRCDALVAEQLPADPAWQSLPGRVLRREPSPVVDGGRGWDQYLAARSRNFREQVRRRERRLFAAHDARFRLTATAAELEHDLEALFRLHDLRWSDDEERSAFTEPLRRFHRDFARVAFARGWLRLWTLEIAGDAVAAWYGFRFAGVESFYQAGRDPAWNDWSVGFVLLAHTVRAALDDGVDEYRLLRGGDPYKDRFATRAGAVETVAFPFTRAGRAVAAAAARVLDLPAGPRRRVRRLVDRSS